MKVGVGPNSTFRLAARVRVRVGVERTRRVEVRVLGSGFEVSVSFGLQSGLNLILM